MSVKRLRIFAGPNGSGKTTIVKRLQSEIPFGVYVNADDIEKSLFEGKMLIFDTYQIKVEQNDILDFFRKVAFSPQKRNEPDLAEKLFVKNNVLTLKCNADSYLAADVAEFIRLKLLQSGISFSFETVMSHKGKLDFLEKARHLGYRIYLYFIATKDVEINISRVNVRVAQKGHPVPADLIEVDITGA